MTAYEALEQVRDYATTPLTTAPWNVYPDLDDVLEFISALQSEIDS